MRQSGEDGREQTLGPSEKKDSDEKKRCGPKRW